MWLTAPAHFLCISVTFATPANTFDIPCFQEGSLTGSMLLMDATPLRPGGQQPHNGAFGGGGAGPLCSSLVRH